MRTTVLISVLMVLLAGCTIGPDYFRPEVDTPDKWRYQEGETEDLVNTMWWKQFDDPVLDELVDIALQENKDVRIAAARVEEFAARVDITRSESFPQLGYGVSGTTEQASRETRGGVPPGVDRTFDTYNATLNVGWELDVWGRIRRATEAARADLLAAEEARRTVILTLVSAVATAYVDLRALDRQLEISKETLEARAESLRIFELQFTGGVISQLSLAQMRTEYEQAAAAIPIAERRIALTENALSILLGRNPGPIPRGKTIDELILPTVPAGVPSDLLARRPDIRQAEQDLIAANARIGVARSLYFPSISLTGLLGYASDDLSNLVTGSAGVYSIGGSVLGPIFTGGLIEGRVRASEAAQRQALSNYLQTIQTAFREVDDALVENQKSREELVVQGRRVAALVDYARLAKLRYDNGYSSYIEVLDAQRELFNAELDYVDVQSAIYTSLVSIYKSMGGGWVIEAQQVADTVDYPAPAEDTGPGFPKRTQPAGVPATSQPTTP